MVGDRGCTREELETEGFQYFSSGSELLPNFHYVPRITDFTHLALNKLLIYSVFIMSED